MTKKEIYKSKAWEQIRVGYALSQNCLCERCKRPVYVSGISEYMPKEKRLRYIVHHKKYLNFANINDESIVYDWNNLELLCIDCHNEEHNKIKSVRKGLMFDEYGNLIERKNKKR